jgi:hypothetical protein
MIRTIARHRFSLNLGVPFVFLDRGNGCHVLRGRIVDGTVDANFGLNSDPRLAASSRGLNDAGRSRPDIEA